jgi:hypothetical protein
MLEALNDVVIRARLTLASQAYIDTANAPIAALANLRRTRSYNYKLPVHLATLTFCVEQSDPTTDEIATTINSFGSLMQSTMPLFSATLAISDAEFATVTGLAVAGGVGLAGLGGGGVWLWASGSAAGPLGLLAASAVTAVAFGAAAVFEGVKWGKRQKIARKTFPSHT